MMVPNTQGKLRFSTLSTVLAASLFTVACGGGSSSPRMNNVEEGSTDTSNTQLNENLVRVLVPLSDDETEPPITAVGAIGDGSFSLDTATGVFAGSITVTGTTEPATSATVNLGAPGEIGPVLITLIGSANGEMWTVPEGATLDTPSIAAFVAGNLYVNVYTSIHPSGEIRGQIIPAGATPIVPPDPTDSAGPIVPGQNSLTISFRNMSASQPVTAPLVALHNNPMSSNGIRFFEVTQPASYEITQLAETGNVEPLLNSVNGQIVGGRVSAAEIAFSDPANPGPLAPGETSSVVLGLSGNDQVLSIASMVVCTNDGFTGVDSRAISADSLETFMTPIYDAGSETNILQQNYWVTPCSAGAASENLGYDEHGAIMVHEGQYGSEVPAYDFAPGAQFLEVTVVRN